MAESTHSIDRVFNKSKARSLSRTATPTDNIGTKSFAAQTREVEMVRAQTPRVMPAILSNANGTGTNPQNDAGSMRSHDDSNNSAAQSNKSRKAKNKNKRFNVECNGTGNGESLQQRNAKFWDQKKDGYHENNGGRNRSFGRFEGRSYNSGRGGRFNGPRPYKNSNGANGGQSYQHTRPQRQGSFTGDLRSPTRDDFSELDSSTHQYRNGYEGLTSSNFAPFTPVPHHVQPEFSPSGMYSPSGNWYPDAPTFLSQHHPQAPVVPNGAPACTQVFNPPPGRSAFDSIPQTNCVAGTPMTTKATLLHEKSKSHNRNGSESEYIDERPVWVRLDSFLNTISGELEYCRERNKPGSENPMTPAALVNYLDQTLKLVHQADDAAKLLVEEVAARKLELRRQIEELTGRIQLLERCQSMPPINTCDDGKMKGDDGYIGYFVDEGKSRPKVDTNNLVALPPKNKEVAPEEK